MRTVPSLPGSSLGTVPGRAPCQATNRGPGRAATRTRESPGRHSRGPLARCPHDLGGRPSLAGLQGTVLGLHETFSGKPLRPVRAVPHTGGMMYSVIRRHDGLDAPSAQPCARGNEAVALE